MKWRAHIRILPRVGLLDPQGQAIEHALGALDFGETGAVHVGKAIVLELRAATADAAMTRVRLMCERLLANPVTEDYQIAIEPAGEES